MKIISSIYNSYVNYYKYADYRLKYVGVIGVIAFPLFYFLPTSIFQNYENPYPRVIAALLCLLMAIYEKWPKNYKRYFLGYSYFALIYCLPFFHTFTIITNAKGIFICDISMSLFLVCLLFDWKNALIVYFVGVFAAIALYYTLTKNSISINYTKNLPEFILTVLGSSLFKYSSDVIEQEKSKTLKSLAGFIAHEMRNPLNSIINAIGYIKISLPSKPLNQDHDSIHQITTKDLVEIYNAIDQSDLTIKRANKIIDSILSNVQGRDTNVNKFALVSASKVVEEAINSFGYSDITDKNFININLVTDFKFFGDQDLFIYVLFNLIKNSLCYKNRSNFRIEITVAAEKDRNFIKIKDHGPGIPKEKVAEIFESFITEGKEGGTGLGLAFCKRVMNSFKGNIICQSEFGKSTEFILIFPFYDSKIINEIKDKILKQKRILVVDDEAVNRLIVKKAVDDLVLADEATNGQEALKKIANNQYDLIFMDIEMPKMNGYEATKNIRDPRSKFLSQEVVINYQKVPIVAITSLAAEIAEQRALFFGMNDFVAKPINKKILLDLLDKWFFANNDVVMGNLAFATKGKTILIVDDENVNLKYSAKILESFDFKVKTAMNGKEAIEILDQENCDLVLMDINMPVLDGYESVKLIRKGNSSNNFDNYKLIPIVGLSGDNSQEVIEKTKESGMNDLICKPISPENLVKVISMWLT